MTVEGYLGWEPDTVVVIPLDFFDQHSTQSLDCKATGPLKGGACQRPQRVRSLELARTCRSLRPSQRTPEEVLVDCLRIRRSWNSRETLTNSLEWRPGVVL